jgi:hypothetical protein
MTHYDPKIPDGIDQNVAFLVTVCFAFVFECLKGTWTMLPIITNLLGASIFMVLPFIVVYLDFLGMCERRRIVETTLPEELWREPRWRLY